MVVLPFPPRVAWSVSSRNSALGLDDCPRLKVEKNFLARIAGSPRGCKQGAPALAKGGEAPLVLRAWRSEEVLPPSLGAAGAIILPSKSLFLALESLADPKHVPVRMPQMHLAHVPRHIRRRKRHIQSSLDAPPVNLVDVLYPHGHPRAFVASLVSVHLKRGAVLSPAASSLRAFAKKNLALARTHRPKGRRRSPVPAPLPAPLLKPGEA